MLKIGPDCIGPFPCGVERAIWMAGSEPYKGVEERLRLAYRLAKMISDHEGPRVVHAWFTGLNPELNARVPVRLCEKKM
jgi:hypothetical protein